MAKPPVPREVGDMLAKPNPAVITTVRPDGQPVSVATWYIWENGRILVNMDEGRKRLEYMRAEPRVSLTAIDWDNWYTHISLQGHVVETLDDPELADIDRLARRYTGRDFRNRSATRVSAWFEISSWHAWELD